MNRSLLAGPEGHPFHPLLVPLPIGAFVSSLIFDILTWTRAGGAQRQFSPAAAAGGIGGRTAAVQQAGHPRQVRLGGQPGAAGLLVRPAE